MPGMSRAEYARHKQVGRSTVTRWIQAGRITLDENGRIDPEAADRQLLATESPEPHHQARSQQIADEKAAVAAGTQAGPGDEAPGLSQAEQIGVGLKLETYRLRKAQAEIQAMERDKLAGLLADRAEVDFIMADIGGTLRALAEGVPDRHAHAIAGLGGDVPAIRQVLADAMRDLLTEIADHIERKAEAL